MDTTTSFRFSLYDKSVVIFKDTPDPTTFQVLFSLAGRNACTYISHNMQFPFLTKGKHTVSFTITFPYFPNSQPPPSNFALSISNLLNPQPLFRWKRGRRGLIAGLAKVKGRKGSMAGLLYPSTLFHFLKKNLFMISRSLTFITIESYCNPLMSTS